LVAVPRHDALPASLPPRGLCREAAAQYIGVGVGKFDQMIRDGRMPQAIRIDGRKVWARCALDNCFDVLGHGTRRKTAGSWDDYINGSA
jgi:hypothetical protein